jgi:hypothetical protein
MDTEAIPVVLREEPMILRALEDLAMLTQNDQERERYESRRKAQLDYATGIKAAELQGRQEGRRELLMDNIRLFERLLHRPETTTESLAGLSVDDLSRLAQQLQTQVEIQK